MHVVEATKHLPKRQQYEEINQQLAGIFSGERDALANAANMAALLFHGVPDLNWCGFYFLRDAELVLGPFQGRVACVRIPLGGGVCGAAASTRETLVVADVHEFAGHIACDAASRSELVVPLISGDRTAGRLWGVLDLDSPSLQRFDSDDALGIAAAVELLLAASDMQSFMGRT